eukprot:scaffold3756_cov180-Ochromonas_danica.AAC.13
MGWDKMVTVWSVRGAPAAGRNNTNNNNVHTAKAKRCARNRTLLCRGFWYGNTRPPDYLYDSIPYANLTVKVNQSYHDGPGNTINRQTFDTQFILDMQYAIGIEPERVFVQYVTPGDVHFSWESSTVIIQTPTSKLFHGTNVTVDIDPLWGLVEVSWDVSVRLSYAIDIVGKTSVKGGYYLNEGSLGTCDTPASINHTVYCEFERFFEDDVSRALNISYYRVQVLFIKVASYDSVIVYFRIEPPQTDVAHKEDNVTAAIANLQLQILPGELVKIYQLHEHRAPSGPEHIINMIAHD